MLSVIQAMWTILVILINYMSQFFAFGMNTIMVLSDLIDTPIKRPRNGKLTTDQKKENTEFASKRVFVEHRIRSIKIFRVVRERFRLKPKKYEQVILTICGLVRLRIGSLILPEEINPVLSV